MSRIFLLAVLQVALLGCAAPAPKANQAEAQGEDWIDVSVLRPSAYFTTGSEPLYLKVTLDNGKVVQFDSANASDANVVVRFSRSDEKGTLVVLESKLDVILKFDLHISPDAQHYTYTSSCPIIAHGAAYEQWAHPIPWMAVSNPQVLDPAHMECR